MLIFASESEISQAGGQIMSNEDVLGLDVSEEKIYRSLSYLDG